MIGGAFVIGLQIAAMFPGTMSRLRSCSPISSSPMCRVLTACVVAGASRARRSVWLAVVAGAGIAFFVVVTTRFAPRIRRFRRCGLARIAHGSTARERLSDVSRCGAPSSRSGTRRLLLLRDPWLMSQSLMQILYLMPPALLLG